MSGSAAMIAVAAAQGAVQSSVSRLPMPLPSNHLLSSPGPGLTNIQTNTTTTASESGGIPEPEPGRFHFVAIDPVSYASCVPDMLVNRM